MILDFVESEDYLNIWDEETEVRIAWEEQEKWSDNPYE